MSKQEEELSVLSPLVFGLLHCHSKTTPATEEVHTIEEVAHMHAVLLYNGASSSSVVNK